MTLRAGLIGCGRIGANINPPGIGASRLGSHADALAANSRVTFAAACDADAGRRAEVQRRWPGTRVFASVNEMLAEPLDLVVVATPSAGRASLLTQLIDRGTLRGILAEKPLAETADEAAAVAKRAAQTRVAGVVNYVRRFAPGYREVTEQIHRGVLGDIQLVRGMYTKGVLNNGGHMLDLLRAFFGDPRSVTPKGVLLEVPGDPTVSFAADFGGFRAEIAGLRHAACNIFELDIVGTLGRVRFSDLGHRLERWTVDDAIARHGFRQFGTADVRDAGLSGAIAGALDNLISCIEAGAEPYCSFHDGHAALSLALQLAADAGRVQRSPL